METMRKVDEEDKGEELLDAGIWGKLQEHIPLHTIYEKLSQQDLFQLRIVSKEWNHAALQCVLPKPSFVTITAGINDSEQLRYLNGIVTYDTVSGMFNFYCQPFRLPRGSPFEVEGLILCQDPDDLEKRGVFNVHTQTWHAIPLGPERQKLSACGLLVDTTVRPYTFKLIEGNLNCRTQIYDSKSKSWSITSSWFPSSITASQLRTLGYSCICHNNNVYMSPDRHMILKYSLEDDKWTVLKFPAGKRTSYPRLDNALGVWAGRIFTTRVNHNKETFGVWELVDSEEQEWVEYAHMPKEQYEWLWTREFDGLGSEDDEDEMCLRSFFRDGYLLVCSWRFERGKTYALALFNMPKKIWQNVDLRKGAVGIDEEEFESSDEDQGDDYFDDGVDGFEAIEYVGGAYPHLPGHFHEDVGHFYENMGHFHEGVGHFHENVGDDIDEEDADDEDEVDE